MSPKVLEAYQRFQPAEKACWEILLRESRIGRQISAQQLSVAIDQTLAQLWRLAACQAAATEDWVREIPGISLSASEANACAFEIFLPYFSSGEQALELVGKELEWLNPNVRAEEREELRRAFDVLVQCQLQRLCATCAQSAQCPHGGPRSLHARERMDSRARG